MKKSLLLLPLVAMTLVGCDPIEEELGSLVDIEVASGLKTEYVQYTIVDLDEISITATFENKAITVTGDELTFNPETLDTTALGEFEITISYLTESVIWNYSVVEYDEIDNISAPSFVTDYFANIEASGDPLNKRNEFMDREQGYYVGDDNPFKFFPTIYAYDSEDQSMEVTAYHSVSVIKERRANEWVELTGAELQSVVAIDDFASTYDFTEEAVGKSYQLTVRPYGEEYATADKFKTSFEFNVADGYNVYKQDDLSIYNNINPLWDAYRATKGISQVAINGLFLHNDIAIERSKLPDGFFYMEGDSDIRSSDSDYSRALGSLRDNVDIYHRDILPGESFVFNGNYFSLDYSSLPYVARESGRIDAEPGSVISHATVIKAGEREKYDQTTIDLGDFTMRNMRIIGNANRSEEPELSGGAIFTKMLSVDSHLYNLIGTQCFTFILTEYWGPNAIIEKTRGYDSYSSMLYNWGTEDLQIIDSEFIYAGGPIIIADHVYPDANGAGGFPSGTVTTNTVMESIVTGNEGWFRLVHAEVALPSIIGLGEQVLPNYGTNSITKLVDINGVDVPHFNLVGVIKDGSAAEPSTSKISGSMQVDDGAALDFNGEFMSSAAIYPPAMPRFESSDGQRALFNGNYLVNTNNQPITPTGSNYFTGPYLNVYVSVGTTDLNDYTAGFMGLVFGLLER
ncbi:MAG: hypothetical protein WCX85_04035 [Bacilli bacterium]